MVSSLRTSWAYALVLLTTFLAVSACSNGHTRTLPLYASDSYYDYIQNSFDEYIDESARWLEQNRAYVSDHHQAELEMNMPFQLSPKKPTNKAVLLVHGLGDSPFTFRDIAQDLFAQGFHVEALLLPGHGSKAEDLMLPDYLDWQYMVDHYVRLLKQQYAEVWLGGFSTGANLVTTHAIEQKNIAGLLLFSPGFKSQAAFWEKFTPALASVIDWGWQAPETNIVKYSSSPLNGALAYSKSAEKVRSLLERNQVNIPTLIVMSEDDSVIDAEYVKTAFEHVFTNPNSRLIWYGENAPVLPRVLQKSMRIPALRISTASHMSPVFKPCNRYYGLTGQKRICENGFNRADKKACEQGAEVWFSAWGYSESDKIHARLTWNPHYKHMIESISSVTSPSALTDDLATNRLGKKY